jgi:hypothetical protein
MNISSGEHRAKSLNPARRTRRAGKGFRSCSKRLVMAGKEGTPNGVIQMNAERIRAGGNEQ